MTVKSTNPLISDDGFRKSKYSMNGSNCVEFRSKADGADIRDTQHREDGHLSFPGDEWSALVTAVGVPASRGGRGH